MTTRGSRLSRCCAATRAADSQQHRRAPSSGSSALHHANVTSSLSSESHAETKFFVRGWSPWKSHTVGLVNTGESHWQVPSVWWRRAEAFRGCSPHRKVRPAKYASEEVDRLLARTAGEFARVVEHPSTSGTLASAAREYFIAWRMVVVDEKVGQDRALRFVLVDVVSLRDDVLRRIPRRQACPLPAQHWRSMGAGDETAGRSDRSRIGGLIGNPPD